MYIKLFVGVVAAVLLCALYVLMSSREAHQERFFTQALTSAGVTLNGQETLATLRTIYARTLAERNPLMALPGTDLDRLDSNVRALSTLEENFIEVNASSSNVALLRSLYPTDFLADLTMVERARRAFVRSRTAADQAAYEAAATVTFTSYQQDAETFKRAFAQAVPETGARFATDGNIISRADILDSVDTLLRAMKSTEARFAARTRCTRGIIGACVASDLVAPTIPITPERSLRASDLSQARSIRAIQAAAHQDALIVQGPMYLLPSSACVANIPGAPLFAFYTQLATSSYSGLFPMYIGNIRFNQTDTARSGPGFEAFGTALREHVTYTLDSPMVHYSCLQMAHDSGKLFAMRAAYELAQSHTLSTYATSTTAIAALRALEQAEEVVSQSTVEAYLNAAHKLTLPADLATRIHDLSLAYMFTSERFDANVGEILNDEESNLALVRLGWPISVGVPYAFFIRSSIQTLLLADNPSAVGALPKLFPSNTLSPEEEPFVYYSELPHDQNSIAELVRDIHFFYTIHIDPSLTGL